VEPPFLYRMSPLVRLTALFGIPGSGLLALSFSLAIPRSIFGNANPLLAVGEVGSALTLITLFLLLRASLEVPPAPSGLYRDLLDFVALSHWDPAVIVGFVALLILPGAWYISTDRVFIWMIRTMGWRVLRSGDFQDDLDRLAVAYQLGLTAGMPFLFGLHMLSRWKAMNKVLLWLLVPVLLAGVAVGAVVVGTIFHFA
jgi:hypothetical protein